MPDAKPPDPSAAPGLTSDGPPSRIGPYKILRTLGEGGMGIVYDAEQTEPVHRRVALKIIKLGMDTKQVVARFEAERQALAVMDHPSIAKVFDGGSTEEGRPYFVMELVKGTPITDYSDRHKLSADERLRLFTQVCAAIQHAHQKGVIHRDLKPSNVLIAVQDEAPVPKVIDFGIAKAIGQSLTEKTLVTQLGQMVGTPEYMSPEQAEMSGLDVDTRTDIYSLGVILYELLVGVLPYDLRHAADFAVQSTIREKDAPRPSARFTTLSEDQQETAARYRQTDPGNLRKVLKGEVDWVVMKCLEKDRTRRYETANALALDIERYLNDEPVLACPPSAGYRFQKFVRRHRAGVAAAAIAILAIVAGTSAAVVGMIRARAAEAVAQREAATAEEVTDFLVGIFAEADPAQARGNEVTAREVLAQGAIAIESKLSDQPAVQARLQRAIGQVYGGLGLFDQAEPLVERALASQRASAASASMLAPTLIALGDVYYGQGRSDDAIAQYEEAIAIVEADVGPGHLRVAEPLTALGSQRTELGSFDEAVRLHERALAIQERELGSDNPAVATTLINLSMAHRRAGRLSEAEPLSHRALEIREAILPENHPDLADAYHSLAVVYAMQERYEEAEPLFRRVLELRERIYDPSHLFVGNANESLGMVLAAQGGHSEAEPLMRKGLEIRERAVGPDHPAVSFGVSNLGYLSLEIGKWEEAERLYRRAIAIRESYLPPDHPFLAGDRSGLGTALVRQGRFAEAEPLLRRALAGLETSLDPTDVGIVDTLDELAGLLRSTGRASEAEPLEARAASIREAQGGG